MKKVFLTLTMLLFAFMGTMRAESLTVNDGTATNGNVPVYGFYADAYNKCEMVYPSDELSEMAGGTINSLTFYASSPASEAWTGTFQVFLSEVAEATISAFAGPGTIVYEGTLNGTQPTMTITFNAPYAYNGGNLLVGVYQTTTGNYKSVTWAGEAVTGASGSGYNYSNLSGCTFTQRNFLPKVTFDYTAGGGGGAPYEVQIGEGTSSSGYFPFYTLYNYSIAENLFLASELTEAGVVAGQITSMSWYATNSTGYEQQGLSLWLANVTDEALTTSSHIATDMTLVYTGSMTPEVGWNEFVFNENDFVWDGTSNLLILCQRNNGAWNSTIQWQATTGYTFNAMAYRYQDSGAYDVTISNTMYASTTRPNIIIKGVGGGSEPPAPVIVEVITEPEELNIGYRPIGYWMEPYTFEFFTVEEGTSATINSVINGSDAFMTVSLETPVTISDTVGAEATVITGTVAPGEITEEFAIDFTGRSLKSFEITGNAYEPVEGDVFELALEVEVPFTGNAPAGIYKNYNLENAAPDALDAIYKVTFENEVLLTAGTEAANGVARIYAENFNGQPGPMVDNYYVYDASAAGYPPYDDWFSYTYEGSNTWYGTSAGGGMIFGYKIPTSILASFGHCYLTMVESAAHDSTAYDLLVYRGGEIPNEGELIYAQAMDFTPEANYFFDMDIQTPFALGSDEDIWVLFYTESSYAAYCGRQPVDSDNSKIWYTLNGSTWYSSTSYTPVIYLHLQYPNPAGDRGEVVLNLADMSTKTYNSNGTMGEADSNVNMPVHHSVVAPKQQRDGYPMIYNQFIPAGTYYLAVASTEENFDVYIQTEAVPAPEQAVIINPQDGDHGINNGDMFQWTLGQYTTEFQIILGTQFPPTDIYQDWTTNLYESMPVAGLQHNKTYFMQVNERNSAGTVYGEIIGFTTEIDGVTGFAAESENLYPGDAAVFTWNANVRTLQGYNFYQDGVLLNETPITETTYAVEGLAYNMEGYAFQISAVYDEGESELSEPIIVRMTGFGTVKGRVFEQDGVHKVVGATVEIRGLDEYGVQQVFTGVTNSNGRYTISTLAGTNYQAFANKEGYQESPGEDIFDLAYNQTVTDINVLLYEYYAPLGQITATLQEEENNVLVEWSWDPAEMIVDFETGDFSQAEFVLPATYPWAITTTNPHEGTYCMKSTCEGIASASSTIEVVVDVPFEEAKMGFYVRTSSESNYDKFHFYIDGVEQGQALSGNNPYAYKEYAVTGGTHTYKWEYTKDSSVNSNDDCIYVDDITLFRKDIPLPPVQGATTYDFDDETMMGWTSIDADADGYGWVSSGNPGQYHNAGVSLAGTGHDSSQGYVISGSYSNSAGVALNPDNYLVAPTQISAVNGAQIQFYACAQDASYAAEHFGVAVSTTTASAGAFTTIQEWTMTAKGAQGRTAEAERDVRGLRQGTWYQYIVDLSAYAGQDIWVAIRHFNCYDMFILNVDDIVLADGSAKRVANNDRSLQHFNLYRRNNIEGDEPTPVLINEPASNVFSYVDQEWANLPYGAYQWGIQAYYEGNRDNRDEVVIGEGTSNSNYIPAYYLYNYSLVEELYTPAEIGTNGNISSIAFQSSIDWVYDLDIYMVNTTKTAFESNSDFAAVAASDKVFSGVVSFTGGDWTTITLDTPFNYDGTSNLLVVIDNNNGTYGYGGPAFLTFSTTNSEAIYVYSDNTNYDPTNPSYSGSALIFKNQIKLDISGGGSGPVAGDGLSEIIWSNVIEKDLTSEVTVNVTLNNGQPADGVNVAFGDNTMTTDENGVALFEALPKGNYELVVSKEGFTTYTEQVAINQNVMVFNVTLMEDIYAALDLYVSPTGWAKWAGDVPGGPVNPPTPPTSGQWYYYDDGALYNNIGASGAFYWAVMFPAGTYTGDFVTKVATYDSGNAGYAFTGTATIYQGGTTAPGTAVGTVDVATTGASEDFVEFEFAEPVNIDDSQNLWVVFYNATSTSYCASAFAYSGNDTNTRWVSLDGSSWLDLANAGVTGCGWMLRVYVAEGAKGEVHEISVPTQLCENSGKLSAVPAAKANRSALSYKVMIDGLYEGETVYPYFQHNVEGFEPGSEHTTAVAGIYATGMGEWNEYTWIYTPCDEYTGATGVTAEQQGSTVKIDWTMPGGGTPTPPTPPTGGWTENFESGLPSGWATIDADGDGYDWVSASSTMGTGYGHNGSSDLMLSMSYNNSVGPLNPNNYLVTPQVTPTAGSTVSFSACAQDNLYAAEHFGVAVSTGSQTSASGFTMLQEWTMTAKDGGVPAPGRGGDLRTQGNWYEYSVDLSSYAGQNIYIAIRHFNCTDMFYLDVDDVTFTTAAKGDRAMWDYVTSFSGTSAGQQGVATDGQYIYTVSWQSSPTGGHTFYQYDLQGNFIEGFEIAGATQIRDLTTDGEYFYGTSGGAQIFCMDFNTRTLVGTINCSGLTSRHISYDPERDGFWSGNWSTLALYSRTGALVQSGPAPTSAYGSAYYKDADNVEHLFLFCQPNSDAKVYDYNITTNTLGTSPVLDFASTPGFDGIAGGCFIGQYNGMTCWFGNSQQDPNLIGIYELAAGTGPTPPPTPPTGDVLGAYVFRDGELISGITPITTGSFIDEAPATGDYEYCVRVVYSDYSMSCPECVTAAYECVPVNNLTAAYTFNSVDEYGVTLAWECAQADYVLTYDIYFSDTIVASVTDMSYFVDMTYNPGEYTFGVVANYGFCESEMVYVDVNVTGVDEIMGNVVVYPNPTNNNVTIEAARMNHITVVNALGQVVYDADVDADMLQLNLGQYTAGLYMVRINTEYGVSVQRVTVVK